MSKNTINLMAIDEKQGKTAEPYFGKGIALASGFDLGAKGALDSRSTVKTIAERDAHSTNNRAYEGMLVYVEENKVTYQFTGTEWREFGFNSNDFEAGIVNDLTTGGVDKALSAEMGKSLKGMIDAEQARAEGAERGLSDKIDVINGNETTEGSIAKSLADAKKYADAEIAEHDTKVTADIATAKSEAVNTSKAYTDEKVAEATNANTELAKRVDALDNVDTGKVPTLEKKVTAVEGEVSTLKAGLAKEIEDRTAADTALEEKITALDTKATQALAAETEARIAGDKTNSDAIAAVDTKVNGIQEKVNAIDTSWAGITEKPFESLGKTLKATEENALEVKVDGTTVTTQEDGSLKVADNVFAPMAHNHDSVYASKAHEENQEIHLTSAEKTNVAKIPTLETDVNVLKTTVGASARHHIVMTKAEMEALLETGNHGDICHVIESAETFILDKNDVDGDHVNPEWIKLSDFNALTSVEWAIVANKPFNTVGEGLTVSDEALTVNVDGVTLELAGGKLKVKDGVFAKADHTHVVDFADVVNKPTTFKKEYSAANFIDGTEADEGLAYIVVDHNKKSTNLHVTAIGADKIERLVAVEHVNENSLKIWTDTKEALSVSVFSLDFTTNPAEIGPVDVALVGKALAGKAVVGKE